MKTLGIIESIKSPVWRALAIQDLQLRYRRATFGPFWHTLMTAFFVVLVGIIYSGLLGQPVLPFLLYISAGFILWQFAASSVNECAVSLEHNAGFLQNYRLHPMVMILRQFTSNFLILLHNAPVFVVILAINGGVDPRILPLAIPGLLLFLVSVLSASTIVALLGARFRDTSPLILTATQLLFVVTPVMWTVEALPKGYDFVLWNPVAHLIAVARDPLTGNLPTVQSWLISLVVTIALAATALAIYARSHRRVVYWL